MNVGTLSLPDFSRAAGGLGFCMRLAYVGHRSPRFSRSEGARSHVISVPLKISSN